MRTSAEHVHSSLSEWILTDGYEFVIDLDRSQGNRFHDARTGRDFLDFFSCFASLAVGWNHPHVVEQEARLGRIAVNNVANSDLYTGEMAWAVDRIGEIACPKDMQNLFMVAGGSLAVENAMKVAMDWKMNHRRSTGLVDPSPKCDPCAPDVDAFCWGSDLRESSKISIGHFREAFHGRSGYTLSTTNTDPNKTRDFIKFRWPRFPNPKVTFPIDDAEKKRLEAAEDGAIDAIRAHAEQHPDTMAGIIIEPIQGEGGDNHFRPEFMRRLQNAAHDANALFMVDEVQTGCGATGRFWAYEHAEVQPDVLAFGKKMQVCGIMARDTVKEFEDNPFSTSSRINSTWGGNLIDMVRSGLQLEVVRDERLVENASRRGDELLRGLHEIQASSGLVSNVRGQGLLAAFSLPDSSTRDHVRKAIYDEGAHVLNSGSTSIRLRPALTLSSDEVDEALGMFERALASVDRALVA